MLKLVVIQIVVTTFTLIDQFFSFFPIHCDVLGHKLKNSCSDLSLLSAFDILRFISCPAECFQIYCDIFYPAKRLQYMTCRLTSDIYLQKSFTTSGLCVLNPLDSALACGDCVGLGGGIAYSWS